MDSFHLLWVVFTYISVLLHYTIGGWSKEEVKVQDTTNGSVSDGRHWL